MVRQKAKKLLDQAGAKAARAAKGKKPALTPGCATVLEGAAGRAAVGL